MSDIEIEKICEKYSIKNYTIKDGLVNVDGSVHLNHRNLTELPLKFGEVYGDFFCSANKLTSLEGSPSYVGGGFYCSYNKLTSLEGSPIYVGDDFICSDNKLTDLKGCPDEVIGNFSCGFNEIYSLEGLMFKRVDIHNIIFNPIYDLYIEYKLSDIDHREFLIEADVIRPPKEKGGLPIINKDRMDWFTQTYGLVKFDWCENYKLEL